MINISVRSAFTFVEMAVVLTVIGLTLGAVFVGQDLTRAADQRTIIQEAHRYSTAVHTFRVKYGGFPGDFKNIQQFWPVADGGDGIGSDCTYTRTTGSTCAGNGDDRITISDTHAEHTLIWEHLALASLIVGDFTGSPDCAAMGLSSPETRCASVDINVPSSHTQNAGWHAHFFPSASSSNTQLWAGTYDNVFLYGTIDQVAGTNDIPEAPILHSFDAYHIDDKMDDGKPGTGIVRTYKNLTDCATTTDPKTADYQRSEAIVGCNMIFNNWD